MAPGPNGTWDPSGIWGWSGTWDLSGTWDPSGIWDPSGAWDPSGTGWQKRVFWVPTAGQTLYEDALTSTDKPGEVGPVASHDSRDLQTL